MKPRVTSEHAERVGKVPLDISECVIGPLRVESPVIIELSSSHKEAARKTKMVIKLKPIVNKQITLALDDLSQDKAN